MEGEDMAGKQRLTVITRFDRAAILVKDNKLLTFPSYEELEKYCVENSIDLHQAVQHNHPAGIRMNEESS